MRRRFFFALGGLILLAWSSSWAHSTLTRSEPSSGAVLTRSPNEIKIWFSEPIKVGLSAVEIQDSNGKKADHGDLRADEREPTLVHLTLPEKLGPGIYVVTWQAVAQDLHVTKGKYSFEIKP